MGKYFFLIHGKKNKTVKKYIVRKKKSHKILNKNT